MIKSKTLIKWLVPILILSAITFIYFSHRYSQNYHAEIKKKPIRYSYELYGDNKVTSTMYISDLKYRDRYLNFYHNAENGVDVTLGFPPRLLPVGDKVHILDYSADSQLVKIASYSEKGKFETDFIEAWVYRGTLHDEPPTEEQLEDVPTYEDYIEAVHGRPLDSIKKGK